MTDTALTETTTADDRRIVLVALRYMQRETRGGRPLPGEALYTLEEIAAVVARYRALPAYEHAEVWRRTLELVQTPEPAPQLNDAWLTFPQMRARLRAITSIAKLALVGIASYPTEE